MPPIIPDVVPDHFTAGTTVKFTRSMGDFPPSEGWSYTIYLNGLTAKFNKAATVVDGIFQVQFDPADTATLPPGPYRYCERLSNTSPAETYDIQGDELVINIEPNAGSAPAGTFNTWEERTLAVVEAALANQLTGGILSYQIAGRAVSKMRPQELYEIRGMLKAAIWRQTHPGQIGIPYRVAFADENDSVSYPPTWQDVTGLER